MIIIVILLAVTLFALTRADNATGTTIAGIAKTNMLIADVVLAFILGYMTGRPGRRNRLRYIPDEDDHTESDTLSEEDRRYIE